MLENNRASIWGDAQNFIYSIKKNDYVFLSHKQVGVVAVGQVTSQQKFDEDEGYINVKWLTHIPKSENGIQKYIPFAKVSELLEHGFYWARTLKTPYLDLKESKFFIEELKKITNV